jgi:hypothetical protein
MRDVTMKIASRWTETQINVGIGPPEDEIDYLPWGTRSLKLAVTGSHRGALFITPEPRDADPDRILAYPKGSQDIQLSWGGGWEKGVELALAPDERTHVFFNVTHTGPGMEKLYEVDIVAYDEAGSAVGRLPVRLTRPAGLPAAVTEPRWTEQDGHPTLLLTPPDGAQAPRYQSRWWPEAFVDYVAPTVTGPLPRLWLSCRRNVGGGYSHVTVVGQADPDQVPLALATVDGDLQFPLVDLRQIGAELSYIAGSWALRLWFFWTDKGVLNRPALAGIDPAERQAIADWATKQEIPDAERVDLVFNKALQVSHLCTDLHWHELWARYDGGLPVRVSIAGTRMHQVAIRGAEGLKVVVKAQARQYVPRPDKGFDPSTVVKEQLRDPERIDLGEGSAAHKHTPYFHDVEFDAGLTSSDVRAG